MKKIIICSLMLFALNGCALLQGVIGDGVKKPNVAYKNFVLGQVSADGVQFKPTLSILNTNAFALPVNSVDYEIIVNERSLTKGKTNAVGTLPANASKDVTLAIDVKQDSLEALKDVLYRENKLDYAVKGKINLMGFDVPFNHSSTLFKPSVKMGKLKVSQASFSKVDMSVDVEIDNKNKFAIPLSQLKYHVSGKGKTLLSGDLKGQKIQEGKNTIRLPLSIKPSQLFSSVFELMSDPKLPLKVNVDSPMFNYSTEQTINVRDVMR